MSLKTTMAGVIDWALDRNIASERVFNVNDLAGRRVTTPVPLIVAAQDIRTAIADLGPEIIVDGFTRVSLWLSVTHNVDNASYRFHCFGRHTSGGSNYPMPIYNPQVAASPYYILAEDEYTQLGVNASQLKVLTWDIANTMPYLQFRVSCGTEKAGGPYSQVASAYVTYGWGS